MNFLKHSCLVCLGLAFSTEPLWAQERAPEQHRNGDAESPRTPAKRGASTDAVPGDGAEENTPITASDEPNQKKSAKDSANRDDDNEKDKDKAEDDMGGEANVDRLPEARGDLFAESGKKKKLEFEAMIQARYRQTWVDRSSQSTTATAAHEEEATAQEFDGYRIRRLFLRAAARPASWISGKILVDFAELMYDNADATLKLAYMKLEPIQQIEIDVGFMKRPFSLLELLPIASHEMAELGPSDDFVKQQGYAGRDLGAIVRVSPLAEKRYLTASVGAFAGGNEEGYEASPVRLLSARLESEPWKFLRLGVDGAWRTGNTSEVNDYKVDTGKVYQADIKRTKGKAFSADVTLHLNGFELRAESIYGQRTDTWRDNGKLFGATWAMAAYRFPLGRFKVMPAVWAEWLDVDMEKKWGGRRTLSAAINVEPMKKLRVIADFTHYTVDTNTAAITEVPWRSSGSDQYRPRDVKWTAFTLQVQLLM